MKICQLIFEQALSVPQKGYNGQFQNQGRQHGPCRLMPASIHMQGQAQRPRAGKHGAFMCRAPSQGERDGRVDP